MTITDQPGHADYKTLEVLSTPLPINNCKRVDEVLNYKNAGTGNQQIWDLV
jgi:hypothetical protein